MTRTETYYIWSVLIAVDRFIRRFNMTTVKEKIMGAITAMSDSDAEEFWNIIPGNIHLPNGTKYRKMRLMKSVCRC